MRKGIRGLILSILGAFILLSLCAGMWGMAQLISYINTNNDQTGNVISTMTIDWEGTVNALSTSVVSAAGAGMSDEQVEAAIVATLQAMILEVGGPEELATVLPTDEIPLVATSLAETIVAQPSRTPTLGPVDIEIPQVDTFHAEQETIIWHRLNPDQGNPTPEHETLECEFGSSLSCFYDKAPEPDMFFQDPPEDTYGNFYGDYITSEWGCPEWFPESICAGLRSVASGVMEFHHPDETTSSFEQELIIAEIDGDLVLNIHWVSGGFVCPWYTTFDKAMQANNWSPPFDGINWPAMDCATPQ